MIGSRISDLQQFYALLGSLAERVGGPRTLSSAECRLARASLQVGPLEPEPCRAPTLSAASRARAAGL